MNDENFFKANKIKYYSRKLGQHAMVYLIDRKVHLSVTHMYLIYLVVGNN